MLFGANNLHAAAEDPNQIKPSANFVVTDSAHILSEQTKQTILKQEQTFKQTKEQPQVAVLTVNNTDGQSIRDFTNDLTLRQIWHAGKKAKTTASLLSLLKTTGKTMSASWPEPAPNLSYPMVKFISYFKLIKTSLSRQIQPLWTLVSANSLRK